MLKHVKPQANPSQQLQGYYQKCVPLACLFRKVRDPLSDTKKRFSFHEPIQSRWTGNRPLHYGYNRTLRLCEQHHCSSFYRKIKTNYYKASGQNEKCRSHHLRRFWTCRTILQIGSNSVSRFRPNLSRFLLDSCVVIGYNSPMIKPHLRRGFVISW